MNKRHELVCVRCAIGVVVACLAGRVWAGGADRPRMKRAEAFLGIHFDFHAGEDCDRVGARTTPEMVELEVVGKGEPKVDGVKLAAGRPVFTDDVRLDGMLYGALLTSPHAHARIVSVDASRACCPTSTSRSSMPRPPF